LPANVRKILEETDLLGKTMTRNEISAVQCNLLTNTMFSYGNKIIQNKIKKKLM
jgi:hypothetical protein